MKDMLSRITDMEEIENLVKSIQLQPIELLEKRTNHWVYITHVIDPLNFYVRLTKFWDLMPKIESLTPSSQPRSINIHDIIIFNMNVKSEKPIYARGKILNIDKKSDGLKCVLYALDYGYFRKNVSLDCVWECEGFLMNMPPLALHCQLANCAPREGVWGMAIDVFKKYFGHERAKMVIEDKRSSNKLVVTLYNSDPDDVATVLAICDFTTLGYVHNSINNINSSPPVPKTIYYKFKKLNINDTLHVRVLNGKSLEAFYVADISDYEEYIKHRDNTTYYLRKAPKVEKTSMKSGDLVGVRNVSLNKYERGLIKEVHDHSDMVYVHLVDLGKDEKVHYKTLAIIPEQCLITPVVGIFCSVKESPELDLYRLFHRGNEFIIRIKELGNRFESPNTVEISPIQEQLNHKTK